MDDDFDYRIMSMHYIYEIISDIRFISNIILSVRHTPDVRVGIVL